MTYSDPVESRDEQWQQPQFQPDEPPAGQPVSGEVVVPGEPAPPPSVAEGVLRGVAGVVWPVMILLAILGYVGFWPAIIIALVTSSVLGQVTRTMSQRRKALARPPRRDGEELR